MTDIAIIGGCGRAGLPLGLMLAKAGQRVVAVDTDERRVVDAQAGRMPFKEKGADDLLRRLVSEGRLRFTTDPGAIADTKILISVIGTPIGENLNPKTDGIRNLIRDYRPHLRDGQL